MRNRQPARGRSTFVLAGAVALVACCVIAGSATAEPQSAGLIGQPGAGTAKGTGPAAEPKAAPAKTPKRPDSPPDNSILAPPLPGYALMFVLGGAVVALNLWSSKRTQLD